MPQQTQLRGWRLDVRNWLAAVLQQQQRSFSGHFGQAAIEMKASFPKNVVVALAAQYAKPLAVAILKSAFKSAAKDLDLPLSDEVLDFLADLAADALLAS